MLGKENDDVTRKATATAKKIRRWNFSKEKVNYLLGKVSFSS